MIRKGRAIVTEVTLDEAGPIHALELWDAAGGDAIAAALGHALPAAGRSAGIEGRRVLRQQPLVWLLDGAGFDPAAIALALGPHGALTAIGGGLMRARLSGPGWRAVLMHDGVFDAEQAAFGPGCTAATIIAHVAVTLHVIAEGQCEVLVPASYAEPLVAGWRRVAAGLA